MMIVMFSLIGLVAILAIGAIIMAVVNSGGGGGSDDYGPYDASELKNYESGSSLFE